MKYRFYIIFLFNITFFISKGQHIDCNQCHINHYSLGNQLTSINGNSNLCISCHNPAGTASSKPFSNSAKAIPGVSGNSHKWDMPSVNAKFGTNKTTNSEMLKRLPGDSIICSTCHNQHSQTYSPFLRASNAGDSLCKNCHTIRNVGNYTSNPLINKGSHPVGITYPVADSRFNVAPIDTNIKIVSTKIECSSCHKMHFSNYSNGYILRTNNNDALCTSCHTYDQHNGMGCTKCHQPHNTNQTNIYMIRDTIATPNSGPKRSIFNAETGSNSFADGDGTYNGVCEVCHTTTSHHRNNSSSDHTHNAGTNCTTCHTHKNKFSAPDCNACHNSTFPEWSTDAHATHVTRYNYACSTCHFQRGSGTTYHQDGTKDINFDPNGLAKRNGADANTPTFNSVAKTCSNVYCHSNGRTAYRGKDATYTWSGTIGSQVATYATTPSWTTGKITTCKNVCHGGPANPPPSPYTVTSASPTTQLVNSSTDLPATQNHGHTMLSNNQCSTTTWPGSNWSQCFWCHNTGNNACNVGNFQGTYGTAFHVDGQTYFDPRKVMNGGTFANWNERSTEGSLAHCGQGPGSNKKCW